MWAKAFSSWSSSIDVRVTQNEVNQFVSMIKTRGIKNEEQFWKSISTGEAEIISTWLEKSYSDTYEKSTIREYDIKYYEGMLVRGLILIANDKEASKFKAFHVMHSVGRPAEKVKTLEYTTYRLVIFIVDSKAPEKSKGYNSCSLEKKKPKA